MWENNRFVKTSSGRLYDIDMLGMIHWPSMDETTTPDLFDLYDDLFPFSHIVPCSVRNSSVAEGGDFAPPLKSECYSNRSDCDDTLMVTSNDALRFEEDCLFETPSPDASSSCRNLLPPHPLSVGANRFLCQKNSKADMTLAQLNDSNASDTKSHRVDLNDLKSEGHDLYQNFDLLTEKNFSSSASKPANSLLMKNCVASRPVPSKQNNACQQSLFVVKEEGHGVVKCEIKTESVSPALSKSSPPPPLSTPPLKTPKAVKRCRTTSVALSDAGGDVKDEPMNVIDRQRTLTSQGQESASISYNCLPVGKKIKLEITESASSSDVVSRVIFPSDHLPPPPPPSKSVISEEENVDSDDLSDTDSVLSKGSSVADLMRPNGSDKRYFWQYNIQAKGPKEKRLCKNIGSSDPHVLKDFEDPVFDPGHSNIHFNHSGKARKGDGTDITPNPQKLLQIGSELKALNGTIEEMMQSSDLVTRTTTMKEKNKYASRVCRLKKKAQHEANKIKLHGLNEEHNQLMLILNSIKSKLKQKERMTTSPSSSSSSASTSSSCASSSSSTNDKRRQNIVNFTEELDRLTKSCLRVNVAGRADDYVSSVLLESSTNADKDDIWLYSD